MAEIIIYGICTISAKIKYFNNLFVNKKFTPFLKIKYSKMNFVNKTAAAEIINIRNWKIARMI